MTLFWFLITFAFAVPEGWEDLGTKNGIEVARKKVENSPLFAFRGETKTNIPAATLAAILLDDPAATKWVDLMNHSEFIRMIKPNIRLVHQAYDMPWPVTDRDFVMAQTVIYNQDTKEFKLAFESVEMQDLPEKESCIRAIARNSYWYLRTNPDGSTQVAVEAHTDPRGILPPWLINMIQKDWSYNTITGLLKYAETTQVSPDSIISGW